MSKFSKIARRVGLGNIIQVAKTIIGIVIPKKKKGENFMAEVEKANITDVLKSLPGLKAGVKSTEFYVTIGTIGTLLTQVLESSNSDFLQAVAIGAAAIVAAAYSIARGLAKKVAAEK